MSAMTCETCGARECREGCAPSVPEYPIRDLVRAARQAEAWLAKASAEGDIFATRALRRLEAAVDAVQPDAWGLIAEAEMRGGPSLYTSPTGHGSGHSHTGA